MCPLGWGIRRCAFAPRGWRGSLWATLEPVENQVQRGVLKNIKNRHAASRPPNVRRVRARGAGLGPCVKKSSTGGRCVEAIGKIGRLPLWGKSGHRLALELSPGACQVIEQLQCGAKTACTSKRGAPKLNIWLL